MKVAEFYNKNPERERDRLIKDPYHSLEFITAMHYIRKHFPANGKVLDAGGGPGRYALALCREGYEVVLLDISSKILDIAKDFFRTEPEHVQKRLSDYIIGDIQDLSQFDDGSFDAVLCLGGTITHVSEEAGRINAVSELARVAKSGAPVYISTVGYLAMLRTVLMQSSHELTDPSYQELFKKGDNLASGEMLWHFFRADELKSLAETCGLVTIEMAGCEGLSTGLRDATNLVAQDKAKWERWVNMVLETSNEPAVVDMAEHILYIGRAAKKWHRKSAIK